MGGGPTAHEDDPVSVWLNPAGIATQAAGISLSYQTHAVYDGDDPARPGLNAVPAIPSYFGVVFEIGSFVGGGAAFLFGVACGHRLAFRPAAGGGTVERPSLLAPAEDRPVRVISVDEKLPPDRPEEDRSERPPPPDQILSWTRGEARKSWWRALEALSRVDDRRLRRELLRELLAKPEEKLVERAAALIGELGGPEAVAMAGQLLAGHPSSRVRRRAARELGELGGSDARTHLISAFGREVNLRVRTVTAVELARLGEEFPRETLALELSRCLATRTGRCGGRRSRSWAN